MEAVDLEDRIKALESAVEADVDLNRLIAKVKTLESEPGVSGDLARARAALTIFPDQAAVSIYRAS